MRIFVISSEPKASREICLLVDFSTSSRRVGTSVEMTAAQVLNTIGINHLTNELRTMNYEQRTMNNEL
jgi:hypothetical protein